MRVLVLGATGMVGHVACLYLAERGHNVVGTFRADAPVLGALGQAGVGLERLDVLDGDGLARVVAPASFDAVVNCVALLNRDCAERLDLAVYINSYLPHRLERLTSGSACKVIHVSTDGIFRGDKGPYRPDAQPDDPTPYGRTKALGELDNGKDLTLRTCVVGPDPDPGGVGLLNWFMRQQDKAGGYSRALWTGVTSLELAKLLELAAASAEHGVVQAVPDCGISKLELLTLFNEHLRDGALDVVDAGGPGIDRRLSTSTSPLCSQIKSYRDQMSDLAEWLRGHSGLYGHYDLEKERG